MHCVEKVLQSYWQNFQDNSTWCRVPVKTQKVLDFEKQSSLSVIITAENGDGGKLVEMIEVTIENENEAPQVIYICKVVAAASF